MDSLLATYASSDDEEGEQQQRQQTQPTPPPPSSSKASSLFSSLPKPQSSSSSSSSSSAFSSLPPPKSFSQTSFSLPTPKKHPPQEQDSNTPSKSSAAFSSLPTPKSQTAPDFHLPPPKPKRVVQFRPPVPEPSKIAAAADDDEDEGEDEGEREKKKQRQLGQDTSVKSFLSSMPAPRSSGASALGAGAGPSLGSGRRSIIETEVPEPAPSSSDANGVNNEVGFDSNAGNSQGNWDYGSYAYNQEVAVGGDQSYAGYEGYGAYGSSGSYDNYGNYVHYASGWYDASSGAMAPEALGVMDLETSAGVESFVSMDGKRRKGQVPTEIVEVKQDELIKNRPREDQSKLTGIAFGPSYQPAPSGKGKPTKLAKRKHQIGALYFDLKQKEMELAERRSKGLLTKAETQAKYGW